MEADRKIDTPAVMHPVGSEEWLKKTQEEILEPELPIVDPHHHLWGAPRPQYLFDEVSADANSGHKVVATVYVDCTEQYRSDGPERLRPVGETEFALSIARQSANAAPGATKLCEGIVSYADLTAGAPVREVLEAHIAAGNGLFKGVRLSTSWDADSALRTTARTPPARLLYDPTLREGFAQLAPLNLTFDSWVYHHQLADVADLAKSFPDTTIILDHAGGPLGIGPYAGQRDEVFAIWSAGIKELARHPNVHVKLGGLAMRVSGFGFHEMQAPPTSEDMAQAWRPYVETCIAEFGAERAMFESNFPVDKISSSYAVLWNAFKRLAAGCSDDEKADLFSRTAARVYSLDLSS